MAYDVTTGMHDMNSADDEDGKKQSDTSHYDKDNDQPNLSHPTPISYKTTPIPFHHTSDTPQLITPTPQSIQSCHHPNTAQLHHNSTHLIPPQSAPNPTQHTPTTTQLTPSHPNTNRRGMINTKTTTDQNHHATQHMETTETRPTQHNIIHESMSIERL